MFLVRNIFYVKPGQGRNFIEIFKKASPYFKEDRNIRNSRILVDSVASFWTVIIEHEVENLNDYLDMSKSINKDTELAEIMKGYTDLINGGKREVFLIE